MYTCLCRLCFTADELRLERTNKQNSHRSKVSLCHRSVTNFNTITTKIKNFHVATETSDQLTAESNKCIRIKVANKNSTSFPHIKRPQV